MTAQQLKAVIPWYVKIAAKLALARIPLPYRLWKRIGIFDHGPMNKSDYAVRVFQSHYQAGHLEDGYTCVELGPGDSLLSALYARAHGAGRIYLVDAGRFASDDCSMYRMVATELKQAGYNVPVGFNSVAEMLRLCRAEYLTNGVEALASIPARTVDFIWSQAVLEHIRLEEFPTMVAAWRRIIKEDGFASHAVDLKDHLNHALNHLRFSDARWESRLFRTSGFYTNRIRFGEMLQLFRQHGFSPVVTVQQRWEQLPTPRARLASRFRDLPDDELLVSGFTVVLRPEKKNNLSGR
jgi:hypothetical protein